MHRRTSPAIVGIADVVPPHGQLIDNYMKLQADVAREALEDAGLAPADVDGVVFSRSGYPMDKPVFPTTFCEQLGLRPAWMETAPHGGAQMGSMVWRAAVGIQNKLASVVLIVCADNREGRLSRDGVVSRIASQNVEPEYELPYGPLFITNFALMAQRHMHEFGSTPAMFASVAVEQRRWAVRHPKARMRDELTIDDVLASRMITSPLHLLDICLVTDGGGAAVMVGPERANEGPNSPVYLLGFGDCGESQNVTSLPDLTSLGGYRRAAEQAFRMAAVGRLEVDLAFPYDATTSYMAFGLEQLGFVQPGEGPAFVATGETGIGGSLPCNTHGGLLSYAHPGIAGAFLSILEAVRQLRGDAGDRQVKKADIAVTSTLGGFITCGVNVFGGASTQ